MTKTKTAKPASSGQLVAQSATVTKRIPEKAKPVANGKAAPNGSGKIGKIIALMRRPKGATIADLTKATDWQAHSVRGAISGTIRKKQGLTVTSEKSGAVRIYRIAG